MTVLREESFDLNRKSPTHTVVLITEFATAVDEAKALIGGVQYIGGSLQYFFPTQSNVIPGLWCQSVKVEPYGVQSGAAYGTGDLAKITCVYSALEEETEQDDQGKTVDLGEESVDFSITEIDMKSATSDAFEWTSGSKSGKLLGDADPGCRLFRPMISFKLKFSNLFSIPKAAILACMGNVNQYTFRGFDPETVLYMGASSNRKLSTDGHNFWECTHQFGVNPNTWNTLPDPAGTGFASIALASDNSKSLYNAVDFAPLLPS